MTIEQVITLLKKRTTTIENILDCLQKMVEDFRCKREDYYIEKFGQRLKKEGLSLEEVDIDHHTDKIHKRSMKDTEEFVQAYVKQMNDQILDAINEKKIKKNAGFCFLTVMCAMTEAFKKE